MRPDCDPPHTFDEQGHKIFKEAASAGEGPGRKTVTPATPAEVGGGQLQRVVSGLVRPAGHMQLAYRLPGSRDGLLEVLLVTARTSPEKVTGFGDHAGRRSKTDRVSRAQELLKCAHDLLKCAPDLSHGPADRRGGRQSTTISGCCLV
jgi:hypothetical protein